MLFVDDDHSEVPEFHCGFDERMCAYQHLQGSVFQPLGYQFTIFLARRTRQQSTTHSHPFQVIVKIVIMLCSQNLGGGHQACLKAVIHRHQHGEECDKCFAGTDIALQQAVHLSPRAYIRPDFT